MGYVNSFINSIGNTYGATSGTGNSVTGTPLNIDITQITEFLKKKYSYFPKVEEYQWNGYGSDRNASARTPIDASGVVIDSSNEDPSKEKSKIAQVAENFGGFLKQHEDVVKGIADAGVNIMTNLMGEPEQTSAHNAVYGTLDTLGNIPGIGKFVEPVKKSLEVLDAGTAKKMENFHADKEILSQSADYSGATGDINKAEEYSGTKQSRIFGAAGKAQRAIDEAKKRVGQIAAIRNKSNTAFAVDLAGNDIAQIEDRNRKIGNNFLMSMNSFKDGGSIPIIEEDITSEEVDIIPIFEIPIEEFKSGGKVNIIPEGALHARKHNLDIDGITNRGIPVISQEDGGEITQQAEIERDELILRLDVTKKIESLYNKCKDATQKEKDSLAIEAGKLLVEEILNNTQDGTGLLEQN